MPVFEVDDKKAEKAEKAEKKQPMLKKHRGVWWENHKHPMSDAEFVEAFCAHVFLTTEDRTLTTVRNRGYRFIRNFMAPQLEAALTQYREDYP